MSKSFFNSTNISKYIFRTLHIVPLIIVGGKLFMENVFPFQLTNPNQKDSLKSLFNMAALAMTVGGFVNIFLLKASQNMGTKDHKGAVSLWKGIIYAKFFTMIFYCDYILQFALPGLLANEQKLSKTRFHIFCMWAFITPFLRFWREHYTKLNNEKTKQN